MHMHISIMIVFFIVICFPYITHAYALRDMYDLTDLDRTDGDMPWYIMCIFQ